MTIEIKNYQEEFLDAQIELVNEATKNWKYFNYPSKEQLLQAYSNENFTPHTRYYIFEGDQLVAFLSSAFGQEGTANLQFPFVKEGYEHLREKLMKKAFDIFEEQEVKEITCNIQNSWENAADTITKFGFENDNRLALVQIFTRVEDFDYSSHKTEVDYVEVDPVKDKEELIKVFQTEMTQTAEQIGGIIDNWKDNENIAMNTISKIDDEIITHSMVITNQNLPGQANMTHISIYNKDYQNRRNDQLRFMYQKLKEKGFKLIRLFGVPGDELETYDTENSDVIKTFQYKKVLRPLQSA